MKERDIEVTSYTVFPQTDGARHEKTLNRCCFNTQRSLVEPLFNPHLPRPPLNAALGRTCELARRLIVPCCKLLPSRTGGVNAILGPIMQADTCFALGLNFSVGPRYFPLKSKGKLLGPAPNQRGFAATVSLRYMFVHFSRILIIDVQHAPIFDAPRDSIRHCSVIVNKSEMVRPKAAGGVIRCTAGLCRRSKRISVSSIHFLCDGKGEWGRRADEGRKSGPNLRLLQRNRSSWGVRSIRGATCRGNHKQPMAALVVL
ncbi:hypothetical protein F2P81_019876 [Scophthalmus maximus]|uniref:Uncharacterized protein n=1 Tax=Scophthalmus maximus TaxID=52904 RepID=A0A6A4S4H0_SCOMX|nr:hypothetical protein F2P81_019876 [Scophthalmus maximus]